MLTYFFVQPGQMVARTAAQHDDDLGQRLVRSALTRRHAREGCPQVPGTLRPRAQCDAAGAPAGIPAGERVGAALHVPGEAHPRRAFSARQRPEGSPGDDRLDLEARHHQRRQGRRRGRAARRRGRGGVSSVFWSEARPGYLLFPGIFLSDRELLNKAEQGSRRIL
jgi:hypothetical protein